MTTIHKFDDHRHAAAYIMTDDQHTRALVSYTTIVAMVDADGWLKIGGLYSMTTRKHLGWFMHELGLTYQHARDLYESHMMMNIFTGEVRDI